MSESNSNSSERLSILRSPQERKETLKKIVVNAAILQESVTNGTICNLENCIQETDSINSETTLKEKIYNQEEIFLDSEVMNISSKVLQQCTKSLTEMVSSYNHVEFAEKLVDYIKKLPDVEQEVPDWSLLEMQVIKSFKRTPQYTSLLGTLTPLEKKEVIRKTRTVRDTQAQIKRPENVLIVEKEGEGLEQTVKMRAFIFKYYKTNKEPLDFFKLVLHPTDFGKTVENILQLSFLVRDGKIRVAKDKLGILVVQPCSKDTIEQISIGKTLNIQNVMCLNMEQWKILKDVYRLKKPMIDLDDDSVHLA